MGRVRAIDILNDPRWIAINGPGVYLFKHADHGYLYIGLAKSMAKRLNHYRVRLNESQYPITPDSLSGLLRIPPVDKVSVSAYLCSTYAEARELEMNLIKRHRPYFNICYNKGV